jgi:hypothetical protein
MTRNASTGSRFHLGEPWDTELSAFCAAVIDIDRTKVARRAISAYIKQFVAENEGIRKEYERIRAEMIGAKSDKVTVLRPGS